jgi:hypothetical protein
VYANPNGERDVVDHRAYTFCVLEHLGLDKAPSCGTWARARGSDT